MPDEGWFPEPFGPEYVRPEGAPCPDCECCTARLCATGDCMMRVGGVEARKLVSRCPCDRQQRGAEQRAAEAHAAEGDHHDRA